MFEKVTVSPFNLISPSYSLYTPVKIFNKVDFPAPFSPNMAFTFPGKNLKFT